MQITHVALPGDLIGLELFLFITGERRLIVSEAIVTAQS